MKDNVPSPADKLITQLAAKEQYGLTPDLFALLPVPILKWQRGRTPLKLYRIADIRQMLQTPEAQQLVERAKAKRAAAAKANIKKEEKKVLAAISEIHIHKTDFDVIVSCASMDNDRLGPYIRQMHELELPAGFEPRTPVFTEAQLKAALRYILSHLASYNSDWFAKGLAKDAPEYFKQYRYAVLDRIAEAYPELKGLCEKRKSHFC